MKIRINVFDNIPKQYHDTIIKKCLREFCDYNEPIIGAVVGRNRIIENIKYDFSMVITKNNVLLITVY